MTAELAQLVPHAGLTSAQTNGVIPFRDRCLPACSLAAEIRHSAGPPRRPATFPLLFESAEIATFTPQEKIKLESDMRTERDIKNQIAYAKKEGREEERERIVENLRKIGASEEMIARAVEAK